MILLIDNYDSFVYNLYQYVGSINPDIKVVRNNEITIEEIKKLKEMVNNEHNKSNGTTRSIKQSNESIDVNVESESKTSGKSVSK